MAVSFRCNYFLLFLLLCFCWAAHTARADCSSVLTDFDMGVCQSQNFGSINAELNQTYNELYAILSPDGQWRLRHEELAWIRRRDSACSESFDDRVFIDFYCAARMGQARISALHARQPKPVLPVPIHKWNFANGTARDVVGHLDGTLHGNAKISSGKLILDGNGSYMSTGSDNIGLTTMTLVAWVSLDRLDQSAGSALSVVNQAEQFDAIDYAERVPGQWMAGSDYFNRSVVNNGGTPLVDTKEHMLAITYTADGTIMLYMDGKFYGNGGQFPPFTFEDAFYLVGARDVAGYSLYLSGAVYMTEVYNVALSAQQIATLYKAEVGLSKGNNH